MSDIDKTSFNFTPESTPSEPGAGEEMHLDDARRIKVMSPGMLVFKRFIRNKLAVVGLAILVVMFFFSFLGPVLSPYTQTQVFKGVGSMVKDFAGATYNTELRYTVAEGQTFTTADSAQFLLALGKKVDTFTSGGINYSYIEEGEDIYRILQLDPVAEVLMGRINPKNGFEVTDSFTTAYEAAVAENQNLFEYEGETYHITTDRKSSVISKDQDVALGMLNVYDPYSPSDTELVDSYMFRLESSRAIVSGTKSFMVNNQRYMVITEDGLTTIVDAGAIPVAEVSDIIVNPIDQSIFLSVDFKSEVRDAINDRQTEFIYAGENEEPIEYVINRVNLTYNIKRETPTELIRMYEFPSIDHWLGLDNNGMDLFTRLMYGGRVSLLVGFVVIFIEVFIGVIVGGLSGYFGGWVDTGFMRFVDLFNSIPFYPMVLIFGSVMDALEVQPMVRIFLLMAVLGILGWTGVARIVRGQILSLREQDFMVATEATGIRTSRRIFKHLVPNVMPLLIVYATAGLGGIIITEATLGFLGLGIKYPLASWGSIINVASDAFVMTNYWFMWIPAGMLILLTVLGFNFVGDGLRDAYDPKMKR
jgi:peptide/nickel transport system permease protein